MRALSRLLNTHHTHWLLLSFNEASLLLRCYFNLAAVSDGDEGEWLAGWGPLCQSSKPMAIHVYTTDLLLNRIEHVQALNNLAEHGVAAVEVRRGDHRDEELRPVCVWPGICLLSGSY